MPEFSTKYQDILAQIDTIDPLVYAKSRNYIDGGVSRLSPYISRGVISTRMVYNRLLERGFKLYQMEKFVQELAWRDFWQRQWQHHGAAINQDLKHPQQNVSFHGLPRAIQEADTGIDVIDKAIEELYQTGYLHNHLRMYLASIVCNVGQYHWHIPAQWMFAHLLDGDWASNALSWQWVAGSNANKKYWANQDNINHFCHSNQWKTFLDFSYEDLPNQAVPEVLREHVLEPLSEMNHIMSLEQDNILPEFDNEKKAICIYTPYNLDPLWRKDLSAHRILLLEPDYFNQYPTSKRVLNFILDLAHENIPEIKVFIGSFDRLRMHFSDRVFYAKEHPTLAYPADVLEARDWLSGQAPYKPSFFPYWKSCSKYLRQELSIS